MIPIWARIGDKWVILDHFADGNIGVTLENAIALGLNKGFGSGMGKFSGETWFFNYILGQGGRFILKKKEEVT